MKIQREIVYVKRRQYGINTTENGAFSFLLQPCSEYPGWNKITVQAPDSKFVSCLVPVTEGLLDTDVVGWLTHDTLADIPSDQECFYNYMSEVGQAIDESMSDGDKWERN